MKVKIILILMFILLGMYGASFAAYLYVDNGTIESTATWSGVDGASYTDSGGSFPGAGTGYATVQNAIDDMSPGDKIYIRGGTYQQADEGHSADIYIPTSLNGDSWEEGHYNYIGSYPGEWAILDGEYTSPKGILMGAGDSWSGCGGTHAYWKFERLEFYRGTARGNSSGGAGLQLRGGPFIIRYNVFRDNFDDAYDNNPGGFAAHILHDSVIEYNYFEHNGWTGTNGDQVQIYTDYYDESAGYSDLNDIDCAVRKNIIRYNYFNGSDGSTMSEGGLKYKASQMLTDTDNTYDTYKEYGDKIYGNIFTNHAQSAVLLRQDYGQFYKNIIVGPAQLDIGQYHSKHRWNIDVYNNTLINTSYNSWLENSPTDSFEFNDYSVNNIFANFDSSTQSSNLFLWQWFMDGTPATNNTVKGEVSEHNYVYNESTSNSSCSGKPIRVGDSSLWGSDSHYGCFEVSEYNTENSVTNYIKASSEGTDNLFAGASGADQYITRSNHAVSGEVTISNGGVGGNHPYLTGVVIPSYLGATDPNDSNWVVGVLALDATYFTSVAEGSTPGWIEGSDVVFIGPSPLLKIIPQP